MPVNPPPIRVPRKFLEDPELRAYFQQELHTFLRLLWERVGAEDEDTEGVEIFGLYAQLSALRGRVEALEADVSPTVTPERDEHHEVVNLSDIYQRLDAIEAQL